MTALEFSTIIQRHRPILEDYERIYRDIHSSPELSGEEQQTSRTAGKHLQDLGFEVHANIGGYEVAGILKNGPGATILLRADMDALPMKEKTGLPYASTRVAKDNNGNSRPVAHACGHDFHVVSLMASAALLCSAREEWSGTLICVFQPAEETLSGAQAMIDDGLFDKIPKPDLVLAQYVMRMRAGQTIVSREVNPHDLAIVSCGSINAGFNANIIPDECIIRINVRTYNPKTRKRVIDSIKRIVKAECLASGAPEEPTIVPLSSTPATINDKETATALEKVFGSYFKNNLTEMDPATASEDFSILAAAANVPYVMWTFGGIDEQKWDDAHENDSINEIGNNHSPYFAPVLQPTLKTGVDAMSLSALHFLQKNPHA